MTTCRLTTTSLQHEQGLSIHQFTDHQILRSSICGNDAGSVIGLFAADGQCDIYV